MDSRKARMVPGMMPRMPPPSILRTVTVLPFGGLFAHSRVVANENSNDSTKNPVFFMSSSCFNVV